MNAPREEAVATHLRGDQNGTDTTGETYCVTNEAFLGAVFQDLPPERLPIVVSFRGDPTSVSPGAWAGHPWKFDGVNLDTLESNNYFSLATFEPNDNGEYKRRKAQFAALHAVMLDDIGTKVDVERLTMAPSWLLETSAGNYQAGYLLEAPLADGKVANRLMDAIVEASLCDPGAKGPQSRLARLPDAVNGKHCPPFRCRLRSWDPSRRYSVEELVEGMQLDMVQAGRASSRQSRRESGAGEPIDAVYIPRPDENVVIAALKRESLYKSPLGDGKHDITCPWVEEHTGAVDGGTAYFEPDEHWPLGGFKCLHGHCAHRHVRDLLDHLAVDVDSARMKPVIRLLPGEIHRVVDAAEQELASTGRHYQRGGLVVTVMTDPSTQETRIQEIGQTALVRDLAATATWERFDRRSDSWARVDPPTRHSAVLFDATEYAHLPVLNGLARQPVLRPDGSLVKSSGYDPSTLLFGVFDEGEFEVDDRPSRVQALVGLGVLQELLAEFEFSSAEDEAAALSGILTAAIRPSLPSAPMFHVRAHTMGVGKSYLCELITAFATPRRGTPMTFPNDDDECRKLLLAELLRAPAVVEFDNLTGDLLPHKSLCTALTSEYMTGRLLGVSKTATVGTTSLFLSSGNNVGPVRDMARRCITISLDPACEVPAARTFKRPDLLQEVREGRGRYVSAALTIICAWIAEGRPLTPCKSVAGFADWSDLCRQPLLWLGLQDPTTSMFQAMAEDPDRETLGRLLFAWQGVFGRSPAMVREAVKKSSEYQPVNAELREVLHDIADERGEVNRRKLGWWIRRHEGRIVDGRRFRRSGSNRSAEMWMVESVSPVLSVSSEADPESVSADRAAHPLVVREGR